MNERKIRFSPNLKSIGRITLIIVIFIIANLLKTIIGLYLWGLIELSEFDQFLISWKENVGNSLTITVLLFTLIDIIFWFSVIKVRTLKVRELESRDLKVKSLNIRELLKRGEIDEKLKKILQFGWEFRYIIINTIKIMISISICLLLWYSNLILSIDELQFVFQYLILAFIIEYLFYIVIFSILDILGEKGINFIKSKYQCRKISQPVEVLHHE